MRTLAAALFSALPLAAQHYFVDDDPGPGVHFTSIAAAIAAVPDGSVLQVRPGVYFQFSIVGKGLKILCDPGVTVLVQALTSISIANTAPHQGVVLRNFRLASSLSLQATVPLTLNQCQGPVLLEDIGQPQNSKTQVHATACDRLLVRHHEHEAAASKAWIGYELVDSHTVIEASELGETSTLISEVALPGVRQQGGTLQLVDCQVRGGGGFFIFGLYPGLLMAGGDARLLGTTSVVASPTAPWLPSPVQGTGTLRLEPTVTVSGGVPPIASTITATTKEMPRVTTQYSGGVATAQLHGPAGHLGALGLALPGPRLSLGLEDPLWLDLTTFGGIGAAVLGSSPLVVSRPLPPGGMPGVRVVFQGLTFDPVVGFQLSNPSFVTLP